MGYGHPPVKETPTEEAIKLSTFLYTFDIDITCIRVIEFWRLKPGFRQILSFNAQNCA